MRTTEFPDDPMGHAAFEAEQALFVVLDGVVGPSADYEFATADAEERPLRLQKLSKDLLAEYNQVKAAAKGEGRWLPHFTREDIERFLHNRYKGRIEIRD